MAFLLQLFLTANKVSKSEGTRKVGCAYHFWKCAHAVYANLLLKLVRARRNYSLLKLARFSRQCSLQVGTYETAGMDEIKYGQQQYE